MLVTFSGVAQVCGFVTAIAAAIALFVKPIRAKLFGINEMREGQKCLLRSAMLQIYYRGKDHNDTLRQYEFENFCLLYAAYKAEKGNSFIDKINKEVQEMEVLK
jgi:hypothetical protein